MAFKEEKMIIDAHCHIYPDAIALRAVEGTGNFYHMPLLYDGKHSTLLAAHDANGVTHAVIFSVATKPQQAESINRFIAEAADHSNGRFVGLGTVHPDSENIEADIEEILALGLRGVKLHPDIQRVAIDDPRCLRIYEICEGRLPVLLHAGDYRFDYSNPSRIAPVLKAFPRLTVIGAHLGGWSVWQEAEDTLADFPNFYVDTSSSLYALTPEKATEIIRRYGARRVMFATDFPMWDIGEELGRFDKLSLTEEERELVLWRNAHALFGF